MMALPLLAAKKVASILGPVALKAAKLAYKMYKKRGGKKTEKKFLSDKANQKLKEGKKFDRDVKKELEKDKVKEIVQRQKDTMGKDKKSMLSKLSKEDARHLKKDKFPGLDRKAKQILKKQMNAKREDEKGQMQYLFYNR